MFDDFYSLAEAMVPDSASWDPAPYMAGPTHASNPLFTPAEPRTLVLALIGIGIIGAYAAMQRWMRSESGAANASQPPRSTRRAA
jgi:hypothetical protein